MKVTFNTYRPIQFRGIHEAAEKIKSQFMSNGGMPLRDGFVPVKDSGTVIIENYYEGGKDRTDFSKMGSSRGSAAAEGVVSGATTGTAIEGTKSVAKKFKSASGEIEKSHESSVDTDDASSVNLLDEGNEAESAEKTLEKNNESELSSEIDKDSEVSEETLNEGIEETDGLGESESIEGIDEDFDELNGVDGVDGLDDVDVDPEIDIEPEIDIDPEIDLDVDVLDIL